MTSPDLMLLPDNDLTEPGDHEKFSHYVPKLALMQALINGIPCIALCGKKWLPTRDPERFPMCPECKSEFEKRFGE